MLEAHIPGPSLAARRSAIPLPAWRLPARPRCFILPSVLLSTLAVGCGGDGDGSGGPPPGGDELVVQSVRPPDGTAAADPLSPVEAFFGSALDQATVIPVSFPVSRDGQPIATTTSYDAAGQSVEIAAPLVPGVDYEAAIETAVHGEGGETLAQRFEWAFTTRSWQSAAPGTVTGNKGLALTADPDGRLHLLFWTPASGGGDDLAYATCATQCLTLANWTTTTPLAHANSGGPVTILAPGGPLHIAYQLSSSAQLFCGTCSSACTTLGGWQSVALGLASTDGYERTALGQDGSGRLHLVTTVATGVNQYGIAYATCAAACTTAANWQGTVISPDGQSGSLVVDPTDRLHVVFRDPAANTLQYATCSTGCLTPGNWQATTVDAGAITFTGTALVLSEGGALHAAYLASGGITYATWSAGCDTPAGWQSAAVAGAGNLHVNLGLAVEAGGRVHLAYGRYGPNQVEYATCVTDCGSGASWQTVAALPGPSPAHLNLVQDLAGQIHVGYEDITTMMVGYGE